MLDDTLFGKMLDEYQIERALGKGGMARVYLALDTRLKRYVALKVVAPDLRSDQEYARRFEREAQSIAQLEHANIVNIYRFGEVNGLFYMAMQYIDGVDVERIVEDYKHDGELMALEDVARIIRDIGLALDYAHSRNVIHRDVKPSNIMLDKTGRAILTDFGLALRTDVGTRGEIFGSPLYIAPEQAISSSNVVPQSDLYALGIVLFFMLTGTVPFKGNDPLEVALRHVSDIPPLPSTLNAALSPQIDAVVMRCLEKEPRDRYQTGAEFSAALDAAVSVGTNRPTSLPESLQYSQLRLPAKVNESRFALPLLPALEMMPLDAHQQVTRLAAPASRSGIGAPISRNTTRRQPSLFKVLAVMLIGALFLAALIALVIAPALNRAQVSPTLAAALQTPVPVSTATLAPTSTPITPTQTDVPTPTALVLISTPVMQVSPPTQQPPPTASPEDRSIVPPNSRRLGDFQVEWYCNGRNLGVKIVNSDTDWACINPNGSINFILQPADFDQICQTTYKNPLAFAIRDQHKDTQAYNWSCYEFISPTTTAIPLATASRTTLQLNTARDWIAFTNVSTFPLSLADFALKTSERTLNAAAWGRSVLNSGECLIINKGEGRPKDLPSACSLPISLPVDKKERDYWLKSEMRVSINPNTQYHIVPKK